MQRLTELDNSTFYFQTDLPAPTSFLVDRDGRVCAIYKGPVSVSQLLNDVSLVDTPPEQLIAAAMPLPGRNGLNHFAIHPVAAAECYLEGGYYEDVRKVIVNHLATLQAKGEGAQTLEDRKRVAHALWTLARAEQLDGRDQEALRLCQQIVELVPTSIDARLRTAELYQKRGQTKEAIQQVNLASELPHLNITQQVQLAQLALQSSDAKLACRILEAATRREPENTSVAFHYGLALESAGDVRAAIRQYQATLQLDAQHAASANNLAWLLATQPDDGLRRGELAVQLATRACKSTAFQEPAYLDTLAASLAEVGRFEEAAHVAERAAELFEQKSARASADKLRQRIELYQQGQRYRDTTKRAE
jgi:tetratricopeptide (TPR) repeat protein